MENAPRARVSLFLIIVNSQLISLFGTSVSGFALGIWIYQQTGSIANYALLSLFLTVPSILLSPFAGVLVDRYDHRLTLILADVIAGLAVAAAGWLFFFDLLHVWHVYGLIMLNSVCQAFQIPTYQTLAPRLLPSRHLARGSGLLQVGIGLSQIAAPLLAALMVGRIGLASVLFIDAATCVAAVLPLCFVRLPGRPEPAGSASSSSIVAEALAGWSYLRRQRGLFALLIFSALANFVTGSVEVLITPLILSFGTVKDAGTILSLGGIGMLCGGLLMVAWGGPRRRLNAILAGQACAGLVLFLAAFPPTIGLLSGATFVFMFCVPIVDSCGQSIWQSKVPPELHGRVFSLRRMVGWSTLPLAYATAGLLADYVFEPAMARGGWLAGTLGPLLGAGPGRGIALMFLILGAGMLAMVASILSQPATRNLEQSLPDAEPAQGSNGAPAALAMDAEAAPARPL
jgi:MFS transporter, DHA3 family, macrolide efflux protein